MKEPLETPVTWINWDSASIIARIIPMWAKPLAPPPPRTRPTEVLVNIRPEKNHENAGQL